MSTHLPTPGRLYSLSDRRRHSSARLSYSVRSSPIMIKKANSCSTIYTDDSTVSQPNLKSTLKWWVESNWYRTIARNSFVCFLGVNHHSRKFKLQNFIAHICSKRIVFQSGITSNYLAVLTLIEACQQLCLWRLLLRPIRKLKCCVSADQWTGHRE